MIIRNPEKDGRLEIATNQGKAVGFAEAMEWGYALSNTSTGLAKDAKHNELWKAKGWKEFVEHMPDHKRASAAVMLENCRRMFGDELNEATRTSHLGTFDRWIFPVIANMAENDVIDQLVSVQPMAGPTSQVVYMDIVTDRAKGQVPQGTPFWRAQQGATDRYTDSDELVENELIGTVTGGAVSNSLSWVPLRPGTLKIVISSATTTDDGNGNIVPSGAITGGTINYLSGALAITTSGTLNTNPAYISYAFDSEGNMNIMGYEMKLSSSPVTAKPLKLKTLWTEEAAQNLAAMYNIKAESILLNAITNALQYQKHRKVIADIRARADAGLVTWDAQLPANTNYQAHKFSVIDTLATGRYMIYGATNMVAGNWVLTGLQLATVISTLPQFVAKGNQQNMQGVTYLGDLAGMKVFADPHFPTNEFIIGHKGDQFLQTGYVLAEYQKLYTTPDIMLPDFQHQRGFATSFAIKSVNPKFYARGRVLNSPVQFGPASSN